MCGTSAGEFVFIGIWFGADGWPLDCDFLIGMIILYFGCLLNPRHLNSYKSNLKSLLLLHQLLCLPILNLRLIALLPLPHEITKHSHLIIVVLVKVKTITVTKSDLEEVVVQTLLWYFDLPGCVLEGVFYLLVFLVDGTRIVLAPFDDFVDDVADASFFGSSAFGSFCHFVCAGSVFLFSGIHILEGHQSMYKWDS